jgi:hypothetical protein
VKIRSKTGGTRTTKTGQGQRVYAWIDGMAHVTLDGSISASPPTRYLTYTWYLDGDFLATGIGPTAEIPVGKHTITLVVDNGAGNTETDEIDVTVIEPMKIQARIFPPSSYPHKAMSEFMAMLSLPPGMTQDEINLQRPLQVHPGGAEVMDQYAMRWRKRGTLCTNIFAFFHEDSLIGDGSDELKIVGRLKTGRFFYGPDTINGGHERT